MPLTRENLLALFAGVLLVFVYTWIGIHDETAGLVADDAVYLLMADAINSELWSDTSTHQFIWDFTKFPPLYPIALSVFGGGSGSLAIAHWITTLITLSSFFVFWVYLRRFVSQTTATLLTLLFAFLPGTITLGLNLWSEHLYLLLSLSLFVVHEQISGRGYSGHDQREMSFDHRSAQNAFRESTQSEACGLRRKDTAGGNDWKNNLLSPYILYVLALMALLCLTRTIGVTILVAWTLHGVRSRHWQSVMVGALALVPLMAWLIYRPGEQIDLFSSYVDLWKEQYDVHSIDGMIAALWTQVSLQSASLVSGFSELLFNSTRPAFVLVSTIMLAATVASAALRAYKNELDGNYLLAYLLVVLLWPNYDHGSRFLYPVLPFFILNVILISRSVHTITVKASLDNVRRLSERCVPVFLLLPFMLIGPPTGMILSRILHGEQQGLGGFSRTQQWIESRKVAPALNDIYMVKNIVRAFRKLDNAVPEDSCVYSVHQELLMLHGNRLSFTPVPKAFDFYFTSESRPCDYFLVLWLSSHPILPSGYPTRHSEFNASVIRNFRLDGDDDKQVFASLYRLD